MILLFLLFFSFTLIAASNAYRKNTTTVQTNATGISFTLYKSAESLNAKNKEVERIFFSMNHVDALVTRILLKDLNEERWEVPDSCEDYKTEFKPSAFKELKDFNSTVSPFTLTLYDQNKTLLELFKNSLVYFDKYIEFDIILPINRLFGLGERIAHFALSPGTYTLWNHENPSPFDDGTGGYNLYSSHPFYVTQTADKKKFLAIFFKNTNAQDAVITLKEDARYQVTHKTIGGVIDLFVFHPSTLGKALEKYHTLIGRPYLPAFWAMGVQQSRWGYRSEWDMKRVIRGYEHYQIPFDALTLDIDYMRDYEIFTVEESRYPNFLKVVEEMHSKKISLVLIVDPGIKVRKGYHVYDGFVREKACIRSARYPPFSVGIVWPGMCVFPDFFNPNAVRLWKEGLKELYNKTKYDGLMLDMLDISSFSDGDVDGDLETGESADDCKFNPANHPKEEFDDLPYYPGNMNLELGTLSVSAYHCAHNEYEDKFFKDYNVHNLFCYHLSKTTSQYFVELTGRRPFMLPRSTTFGSGHYTSHWQGDNWSTWAHMRLSVAGLFSFQLFGIPHVGSDVCGFGGSGDAELCARWYQVGAFYTFTRNHNMRTFLPQEPWWFYENEREEERELVVNAAKSAIRQKYSLLRLYYTKMIEVHLKGGYVVGPMFFEYPEDDEAFSGMEESVMVGGAVLVSLALRPKQYWINQYFPNADWYELKTGKRVRAYDTKRSKGDKIMLEASFNYNHMHIKGGSIIPYQETEEAKILRAVDLLEMPIDLIIALTSKPNPQSAGTLIVEDGITAGLKEKKLYKQYNILCSAAGGIEISFSKLSTGYVKKFANEQVSRIRLYGVNHTKKFGKPRLTLNNGNTIDLDAEVDKDLGTMVIDTKRISIEDMKKIVLLESVRSPYDL
eukprot:TRINITY_DN5341_c0_g2_i2.p1 TRINITY_DN5341_c0_g2~~TRINITY_DN5341_c0_g2_i2.p1  ORF type:complete len:897 (+),score=249.47 TRINITY_DN5341_c0_g2_i2:103-2793(+)